MIPGLAVVTAIDVEAALTSGGPWIRCRARTRNGGCGIALGTFGMGREPLVVQGGRPMFSLSLTEPATPDAGGQQQQAGNSSHSVLSEGVLLSQLVADDTLAFLAFTSGRDPHRDRFQVLPDPPPDCRAAREAAVALREGRLSFADCVVTITFQAKEKDNFRRLHMIPIYAPGLKLGDVPRLVAHFPPSKEVRSSSRSAVRPRVCPDPGGPSAGPHPWVVDFLVPADPKRRNPHSLLPMTFFCDCCRTKIAAQDPVIHCFTCSANEKQRHDWLARVSGGQATESVGYDLCRACHASNTHGHDPNHVMLPLQKMPQPPTSPRRQLRRLVSNWRTSALCKRGQSCLSPSTRASLIAPLEVAPLGRWLEATPRFWAETPAYSTVRSGDANSLYCLLHHPLVDCNQRSGRWLTDASPDAVPGSAVVCFAQTPLDLAVELRMPGMVRTLLQSPGIDPRIPTVLFARGVEETAITARDRAVRTGQAEVVWMIDSFTTDRERWLQAQRGGGPIVPHGAALGLSPETAWVLPAASKNQAVLALWALGSAKTLARMPRDLWIRSVMAFLS